jgi:hypothetical protein
MRETQWQIELDAFLAAGFEGRIRLANQAHGARLWSHQLASVWSEVLGDLAAKGKRASCEGRQLMRELIALAPDSDAAEQAYQDWIGDNDRLASFAPPPIIYLIISCQKPQFAAKAIGLHRELSAHLQPIFILVGNEDATVSIFDAGQLTVPACDHYEGLVWKVLEGLVAVRRRFGKVGVLKIDDDTRLTAPPDTEGISELIASTQYAGHVVGDKNFDRCWHVGKRERFGDEPYRRRFRGRWAAGSLYYLGPQAVELLVREYLFYPGEFDGEIFGLEDKAVGDVLGSHGLYPTRKDLSRIFGISGPFDGSFGADPPPSAAKTLVEQSG